MERLLSRKTITTGIASSAISGAVLIVAGLLRCAPAAAQLSAPPVAAPDGGHISAPDELVDGVEPHWTITGIPRGKVVELHVLTRRTRWSPDAAGRLRPASVILDAWAKLRADDSGRIDGETARPLEGTYSDPSAYGLFWSGVPVPANETKSSAPPPGVDVPTDERLRVFVLEIGGHIVDTHPMKLVLGGAAVVVQRVTNGDLVGDYARPKGRGPWPAVILLHGSEGGDLYGRAFALRFAAQGLASFALTYFVNKAHPSEEVSNELRNIPLEKVDAAYHWLARQPEVDARAIGIEGTSRGAELALLAGSYFHWPKAVVACVPSDLVWPGWSALKPVTEDFPAWTYRGSALAYMSLDHGPGPMHAAWPAPFKDAADSFQASRMEYGGRLLAARIPVERLRAPLLLLGSGEDTTWPSGAMAQTIAEERASAGHDLVTELYVYPLAGHQICGGPNAPLRMYEQDGENGSRLSTEAEGEAAVDAWQRTIAFLKGHLSPQRAAVTN